MNVVFTLCSNSYLAKAKTLGDSLAHYCPDYTFIIGLVDRLDSGIDYQFFKNFVILSVEEIELPERGDMISRYNLVEFVTAVKPFYFKAIQDRYPHVENMIYLDPDTCVYHDFSEIEDLLKQHAILLTPHLLKAQQESIDHQLPAGRLLFEETNILKTGIFNLGFLALNSSQEAQKFLEWWCQRLTHRCLCAPESGMFFDQLWINFVPLFFPGAKVLDSPGYNVAWWNLKERLLRTDNGHYRVNDDYDLIFFHYSGYNPTQPDCISRWSQYTFEQRPDVVPLFRDYQTALTKNQYRTLAGRESLLPLTQPLPEGYGAPPVGPWLSIAINRTRLRRLKGQVSSLLGEPLKSWLRKHRLLGRAPAPTSSVGQSRPSSRG
ncbi:MAG: glycosyl transferase [Gloeomargaritaceae cyanobacterium C42_A2020_066]|nr:glycosyl transferase [Gloeomargaritaceae cyanobacterium C42_A2020_066]